MKTLKGTEKQVKWAEDIRNNAIDTINANIKSFTEREKQYGVEGLFQYEIKAYIMLKEQITATLDKVDSAAKIIDNRMMFDPHTIVRMADEWSEKMKKENK